MTNKTINCATYAIGIIAVIICTWAIYMAVTGGDRPPEYYCEHVTARSLTARQLNECEKYLNQNENQKTQRR